MKITSVKKRDAISPVIATVILIAITLIAAIAIAGFVFGLFGSFSASAQVIATASCNHVGATGCTIVLTNSGTATTTITGAGSITFGGAASPLSLATACTGSSIAAGGGTCSSTYTFSTTGTAGEQYVGSVNLANGASVEFSGTFS